MFTKQNVTEVSSQKYMNVCGIDLLTKNIDCFCLNQPHPAHLMVFRVNTIHTYLYLTHVPVIHSFFQLLQDRLDTDVGDMAGEAVDEDIMEVSIQCPVFTNPLRHRSNTDINFEIGVSWCQRQSLGTREVHEGHWVIRNCSPAIEKGPLCCGYYSRKALDQTDNG